jgi:hypothetical protein
MMMKTYGIDLAYKLSNTDLDLDGLIEEFLSERTSSGMGFGLRDMQWNSIPEEQKNQYNQIVRELKEILPPDQLAYISMYEETPNTDVTNETEIVFDYQAPWYKSETRRGVS